LVGLSKVHRNTNTYISFLNTTDWSVFHRSQLSTWVDPFWPIPQQNTGDIIDELSDDSLDAELSGLDVYDPAFEQELNDITNDILTGDEDFGFTTDGQNITGTHESADTSSKSELLRLIQQRELTK
jgi:hypothetical protein